MKKLDLTVNVPKERVITLKLPDDVSPGEHRVVVVIDQSFPDKLPVPSFSLEGLWAGGLDISPEAIAEARKEMWRKFDQ